MEEVELRAELEAPPERVWSALSDLAAWQTWAGLQEVVVRQPGDPPPNGLGAIRVMRRGGLAIEEEVTEFDPPRAIACRVRAGLPVRACISRLELAASRGATQLTWRVCFRALLPGTGWLLRRLLRPRLAVALEGLAQLVRSEPGAPRNSCSSFTRSGR